MNIECAHCCCESTRSSYSGVERPLPSTVDTLTLSRGPLVNVHGLPLKSSSTESTGRKWVESTRNLFVVVGCPVKLVHQVLRRVEKLNRGDVLLLGQFRRQFPINSSCKSQFLIPCFSMPLIFQTCHSWFFGRIQGYNCTKNHN